MISLLNEYFFNNGELISNLNISYLLYKIYFGKYSYLIRNIFWYFD